MTILESLVLDVMQVSDAGLEHLQELTNLKRLYLDGTQVTDNGVEKLQQLLPDYKIDHWSAASCIVLFPQSQRKDQKANHPQSRRPD